MFGVLTETKHLPFNIAPIFNQGAILHIRCVEFPASLACIAAWFPL